jgi:hypothetical protein
VETGNLFGSESDDGGEMTTRDFTPAETERLLAGSGAAIDSAVADALTALRASARAVPTDDYVTTFATQLAAEVPATAVPAPAAAAWRRRLVAAAAVAGAMLVGGAGMAAAADGAAPGDALYGLDRALEDLGIGDGGAGERYDEAADLMEDGDEEGALEAATEGAETEGDEETVATLLLVAQQLRENGSEQSADVHERVATMLEWMATTDATGKEFGQGVSLHARGLWVDEPTDPDAGVTPSPSPSAEPSPTADDSAPGKSGGTGKPETPGKPDGAGKPETPGKPDGAGKPETPGKGKP